MTPAERTELDEALAYLYVNNDEAPLIAFAERLTAGEEVVRVVNPEYPGDKHYWAANSHPAFPASYIITPGTFRVTPLDGGTDG